METIWLNISAGSGPEECAHAAVLTVQALLKEIQDQPELGINASVIEIVPSREKGNIRSAMVALEQRHLGGKPDGL